MTHDAAVVEATAELTYKVHRPNIATEGQGFANSGEVARRAKEELHTLRRTQGYNLGAYDP